MSAFLLVALLATSCGDSVETTVTAAAPEVTTTTASATTAAAAATLTFTGAECVHSGPDAFSSSDVVTFTARNESSVLMFVIVLEIVDTTLEDLVADDVRLFPPTETWPPPGAHPRELRSHWGVEPGSEKRQLMALGAGTYGTACYPIDGSPALQGAPFTVVPSTASAPIEETTTVPKTTSPSTTLLELTDIGMDDLVGKWKLMGYVDEFTADGRYNPGSSEFGVYRLEDNILTIQFDEESSFCPGAVGVYEAGLTSDGLLHLSLVEDECTAKGALIGDSAIYTRVES